MLDAELEGEPSAMHPTEFGFRTDTRNKFGKIRELALCGLVQEKKKKNRRRSTKICAEELQRTQEMINSAISGHASVHSDVCFIPFEVFKNLGSIPRMGSNGDFVHPLSNQANANSGLPLDHFDRSKTVFIFVSHRWLSPRPGTAGHPDDVDSHSKHQLIVEGCERMRGTNAPIRPECDIALWIDFGCVNQDGEPAAELEHRLAALIGVCDLLLTPVVDPQHEEWILPLTFTNAIEDYRASAWQEYWSRAWCRSETFLAAVIPVISDPARATLFNGGLKTAHKSSRRAHVIFGSKELEQNRLPIFVPPMMNATYYKYAPEKGYLTCEDDRPVIASLTDTARAHITDTAVGYFGDMDESGQPHGYGRRVFEDGGIYDGEWVHGKEEGLGRYTWTWGDEYTGGWKAGQKCGYAIHVYADGGRFEGEMRDDKRNGFGRFIYPFGDRFDGIYGEDLKLCGLWSYADGEARVCRWELHESGAYSVIRGEGAIWNAERTRVWRLEDDVKREEISLEEARDVCARLGLKPKTPRKFVPPQVSEESVVDEL